MVWDALASTNRHALGMADSIHAMMGQTERFKIHADNIANFGVPGYQRHEEVITSFAEQLGKLGVDRVVNPEIGRIRQSGNPLDVALTVPGYFRRMNEHGEIELTRDGRLKIDAEGVLRSTEGKAMLAENGQPVRLQFIPANLEAQFKINGAGDVFIYDPETGQTLHQGRLAVADQDGTLIHATDLRQGYVEDSNVYLQQEFVSIMPIRREFEANRQMFITQNDSFNRMIQELGRTQ